MFMFAAMRAEQIDVPTPAVWFCSPARGQQEQLWFFFSPSPARSTCIHLELVQKKRLLRCLSGNGAERYSLTVVVVVAKHGGRNVAPSHNWFGVLPAFGQAPVLVSCVHVSG